MTSRQARRRAGRWVQTPARSIAQCCWLNPTRTALGWRPWAPNPAEAVPKSEAAWMRFAPGLVVPRIEDAARFLRHVLLCPTTRAERQAELPQVASAAV